MIKLIELSFVIDTLQTARLAIILSAFLMDLEDWAHLDGDFFGYLYKILL